MKTLLTLIALISISACGKVFVVESPDPFVVFEKLYCQGLTSVECLEIWLPVREEWMARK